MSSKTSAVPEGYHSVTPYLIVDDAMKLIEFMKQAFDAEEKELIKAPDGTVGHAEIKVGDSVIMMGQAGGDWKPMPTGLYLYVADADAAYKKAPEAGATSVSEVADQFYGDRNGGVKDPSGNLWWIATRKENVSPEELQRRAAQAHSQKQ